MRDMSGDMYRAAYAGDLPAVQKLIKEGESPFAKHGSAVEYNALHLAAERSHDHVVSWLVKEFPDLAKAVDAHGRTPLHWAAEYYLSESSSAKCVEALLQASDPGALTPGGETAADLARDCGRAAIAAAIEARIQKQEIANSLGQSTQAALRRAPSRSL